MNKHRILHEIFRTELNKFNKKYLYKKIYGEVTDDIFDLSNVRFF